MFPTGDLNPGARSGASRRCNPFAGEDKSSGGESRVQFPHLGGWGAVTVGPDGQDSVVQTQISRLGGADRDVTVGCIMDGGFGSGIMAEGI